MSAERISLSTKVFEHRSSVLTWCKGRPILIGRVEGRLYAIDAVCAHVGCALLSETEGFAAICPAHGAQYDLRTGALLVPPRIKPELPCEQERLSLPLRTYPVSEKDGMIEIDLAPR